ncbi:DNA replication/repair protein RecF [Gloeocapsa sp. PCC 73106]|uniref:DNA replication/repair protein RecF n=1 Tax=Gloeocapsa sp. PCC 73106 TaxID=102232 RepID=UPI0002ABEFA5|nr:DNA replication/repair protein RecF [Gloeocapsa sp. PCC 73106]ELR99337.1 DNA replication and repair protein RecF [Gloeocapsa sp. PCC 73106]
MFLRQIQLFSFRNYLEQKIKFDSYQTILLGNNAQGKTNLLEAVELISTLKSQRSQKDQELILKGQNESHILATLERSYGVAEIAITLRASGRRSLMLNHEHLRRHLDILGVLNTVQFSSLDLDLVRGAPEVRRHWIDSLLIQLEPVYAYILHKYTQILRQRNALLKILYKQNTQPQVRETTELAIWNEQLATFGSRVMRRRARVISRLAPIAQNWHKQISGNTELLEINYTPNISYNRDETDHVQQAFLASIEERSAVEQQLGTTVVGPHRDELELLINTTPAKSYGSQGQQRTLVLSLKLAELELIEQVIGEAPVLLLDDVLAELDLQRQNQLLEAIAQRCQTLITTTHLNAFDQQWLKASQILSVQAGNISLL